VTRPAAAARAHELHARCQPDAAAEREHLSALLPAGLLPAGLLADGVLADGAPADGVPADGAPAGGVLAGGMLAGGPDEDGDPARCAVLAWARSGLMSLTGVPGGPPLAPAEPVLPRAVLLARAVTALSAVTGRPVRPDLRQVLAYRASLTGRSRAGTVSAGGSCRILRAADGWLAVNLARPEDIDSVPAILARELDRGPWAELASDAALRPAADLAAAAQAVGVPAAALGSAPPVPAVLTPAGEAGQAPRLVLDLSAMWAGPLCAQLLSQAGWRVLKVEDARRPDGARLGPPAFYAGLHAGCPAVRLDFGSAAGRAELARLAALAGVVIESSRPRALRRLGLVAEDWLAAGAGRVWVSLTGYGRADAQQRVAFGDDAAVAGGLVARAPDGTPVFCGDAIADPLSGLWAALAALAALRAGGGWLADVAMAGVCADLARPSAAPLQRHVISAPAAAGLRTAGPAGRARRPGARGGPADSCWTVRHDAAAEPVAAP
jgi:hypothetical protein